MGFISRKSKISPLDEVLLTQTFVSTGTATTHAITIQGVTSYTQLEGKQIRVQLTTAPNFNGTITLNVSGLGAKQISKYNANDAWKLASVANQVYVLEFRDPHFKLVDFGTGNPVDATSVTQSIAGNKSFSGNLGLLSPAQYFYWKQASITIDTQGDTRTSNTDGIVRSELCTLGSATKGGGTWVTVSSTGSDTLLSVTVSHGTFTNFDNLFKIGFTSGAGARYLNIRTLTGTRVIKFGTGTNYDSGGFSGVGTTGETATSTVDTTTGVNLITQTDGFNSRNTTWVLDVSTGAVYEISGWYSSDTTAQIKVSKWGADIATVPLNVVQINGSWESVYTAIASPAITIGTTETDLTSFFGNTTLNNQGNTPITYSGATNVFKALDTTTSFYQFNVHLRLSGTLAGGTGTQSVFRVILRRGDGTFITDEQYIKPQGSATTFLSETIVKIKTRVFQGGGDPFQTLGFRISMIKVSGSDITLGTADTQRLNIGR
jgi:hypothetical protein